MRHFILLGICLGLAPAALANPIYRWVDDQGVTNYTNDASKVPAKARAQVTSGDEIIVITSERAPSAKGRVAAVSPETTSVSTDILRPDERVAADQWRAAFRDAHARISFLEVEIKSDLQLLEQGGIQPSEIGINHWDNQPWTAHPGYLLVQQHLQRNLAELNRARADLDELERAASREVVPREWRQP
jgi:hypothetical protein